MILLSKSDKTKEVSLCVPIKKGKMKYSSMQSRQKRRLHGVITVANILNMLALLLDYLIKEEARMKYINANSLLPDKLVKELQRYIQGGYIYIPVDEKQHRYWGELSGYKEELRKRNSEIIIEYNNGFSIKLLAEKYNLSVYAIRKIIYQK